MSSGQTHLDETRLKSDCKTFCFKYNHQVSFDITTLKNIKETPFPSSPKRHPSPKNLTLIYISPLKIIIIINAQILTNVSAVTKERWEEQ